METKTRIILTRIVAAYILLFLILRFFLHVTPSRLLQPPLSNGSMDITYWTFRVSGILNFIVSNKITSIIFDTVLFATGLMTLLFSLKRRWLISFSILLFLLSMIYNNYSLHHNQTMAGFMIVLLAFWPQDNETSFLLWEGIRYLTCLIYPLAFFWKTIYGKAFYYWPQGAGSTKANLVEYMYMNPDSLFTGIIKWFLQHAWILNAGTTLVELMELTMIIGIFTKKYDGKLFWLPIIIHVSTYFFSDVLYYELLVLDISLLSMIQINKIGKRLPLLSLGHLSSEP